MEYYPDSNIYRYENRNFIGRFGGTNIIVMLNDTFELIEENQDIDIQTIEELRFSGDGYVDYTNVIPRINKLLEAIKQLDRQINNN